MIFESQVYMNRRLYLAALLLPCDHVIAHIVTPPTNALVIVTGAPHIPMIFNIAE